MTDASPRRVALTPWALRAVWATLPFTAGPALSAALHHRDLPLRTTASIGLWAVWAVVLVATLVPHPIAMTVVRIGAPAAVAASVVALWARDAPPAARPMALVWTALAATAGLSASAGAWFVNGPAYANERRYPLRVAGPLLLGPLELAWALVVAGPAAALALLASRQWVLGGLVAVVGLPVAVVLARALHSLGRRWLVFVPAGLVIHDPVALADPVLFRRELVEALRPAPAGSDSLDLTQAAPGLALELLLTEKVPMTLVQPGKRSGEAGSSARLLFTPTRPGALLADAASRRLPVG